MFRLASNCWPAGCLRVLREQQTCKYSLVSINDCIASNNMTGETLLTILEDHVQKGSRGTTKDDRTAFCQHVRNDENSYLTEDAVMGIVIGNFVITLGNSGGSVEDGSSGDGHGGNRLCNIIYV